jgi:LacI family transcriptional regulator
MRPTVHDIARKANVSLATVDRVLNNRPGVREKTRALVEQTIAELGYVRDVAAANLAKKRRYVFEFLLPDGDNSFIRMLGDAVHETSDVLKLDRTELQMRRIPAFDAEALANEIDAAVGRDVDGIAIVAIDDDSVRSGVARATEASIPVVTIVSDLPGSRRVHFAGIDNVAAGRTAASLLGRFMAPNLGKVAVIAGSLKARDHRERLAGFEEAMRSSFPGFEVLPVVEGADDPKRVEALATALLETHSDLAGIYSLGAGNRGLVRALKRAGVKALVPVIAHELTEVAREALSCGIFDAVLNQDAAREVRSAVRVMKAHADGLEANEAQERIRIDIFLKDNMP